MRKKIVVASLALIIIILLIFIAVPVFAILGESMIVRWNIDNHYVNGNFDGWHQIHIEGYDSFSIPQGWSLQEADGIYLIKDNRNIVWAYGAALGSENAVFSGYKDFLTTVCDMPSADIERDPFNRFSMMDGSDIDLLQIKNTEEEYVFYCIQMFKTIQEELVWLVVPDISVDEDQYDIAEAIVYSFAF